MKFVIYAVIIAILILGGLRLVSRKLLYFPVSLDPKRAEALARLPQVRPLAVDAGQGIVLKGWLLEKDMDRLPTIFYFGGNAEEVSLNIEDYLARVPANVVLVNYRGYGQSSGSPKEPDLKTDSLKLFDALSDQYGLSPDRCLAWGRSLGSSMATYLARERGLSGLILTCPFDSIEAVAAGFYPRWLVGLVLTDPHRTTDFSGMVNSRTLILAAEADEIIPFARTKALYDSLTCEKQLEMIKGAGHNTISEARGYYEAVEVFLAGLSGEGETQQGGEK